MYRIKHGLASSRIFAALLACFEGVKNLRGKKQDLNPDYF
jgi:hypothetical protein